MNERKHLHNLTLLSRNAKAAMFGRASDLALISYELVAVIFHIIYCYDIIWAVILHIYWPYFTSHVSEDNSELSHFFDSTLLHTALREFITFKEDYVAHFFYLIKAPTCLCGIFSNMIFRYYHEILRCRCLIYYLPYCNNIYRKFVEEKYFFIKSSATFDALLFSQQV